MVTNPLKEIGRGKRLSEDDIPKLRHLFMECYGWISKEEFENIDIDELLTLLPFVQESQNKKEELRLYTLKYYGIKNPK